VGDIIEERSSSKIRKEGKLLVEEFSLPSSTLLSRETINLQVSIYGRGVPLFALDLLIANLEVLLVRLLASLLVR
jgi:hypothetical protein